MPTGAQPSNTVDFSVVGTSSGAPLSVNASGPRSGSRSTGLPCTPPTTSATERPRWAASAANWTFLNGPGSNSASNFTTIFGATTGSTDFLAGGSGGLTLDGQGNGNSAQFFGSTGVVANLSGGPETTSAQIAALDDAVELQSRPGSGPGEPARSGHVVHHHTRRRLRHPQRRPGALASRRVTGPTSGFSTFYAGAGPGTYTFSDDGSNNTFIGGSGPDDFSSAGNDNTFVAGTGSATFNESTPTQGANNTINFSNAPVGSASGCDDAPAR